MSEVQPKQTRSNPASSEHALEFFLKNLWENRSSGIEIPAADVLNNFNSKSIEYLINLYPFLQIVSTNAVFLDEIVPSFITAKSNWVIHDYGEAMSSSPGNLLYSSSDYYSLLSNLDEKTRLELLEPKSQDTTHTKAEIKTEDDDRSGGESGDSGTGTSDLKPIGKNVGTIVKQAHDTAAEMIELCIQKGWPGIKIVAGSPVMKWAAWKTAYEYSMDVLGFTPDKRAYDKKNRLKAVPIILDVLYPKSVNT